MPSFDTLNPEAGILEILELAFTEARLRRKNLTPELQDFYDHPDFSNEKITGDVFRAEEKKEKFTTDDSFIDRQKNLAELTEYVIAEQIELSNWLGNEVRTAFASEYDDLFHGVDFAIGLNDPQEDGDRYLAIDITFSHQQVEKKLRRIKKAIDEKVLSRIDYCEDDQGRKFSAREVPQCVLLFSKKEINALAVSWTTQDKKSLADHPFQHALVEQIGCQLSVFEQYAKEKENKKFEEIFLHMRTLLALGLPKNYHEKIPHKMPETVQKINETLLAVFRKRPIFPKDTNSFGATVSTVQQAHEAVKIEDLPKKPTRAKFGFRQAVVHLRQVLGMYSNHLFQRDLSAIEKDSALPDNVKAEVEAYRRNPRLGIGEHILEEIIARHPPEIPESFISQRDLRTRAGISWEKLMKIIDSFIRAKGFDAGALTDVAIWQQNQDQLKALFVHARAKNGRATIFFSEEAAKKIISTANTQKRKRKEGSVVANLKKSLKEVF